MIFKLKQPAYISAIFGLILYLLAAGCTKCQNDPNQKVNPPTSFFVSLDGLQPDMLKSFVQANLLPSQYGFAWMLKDSIVSFNAKPVVTTLTAASHISTITCSPPSRHQIIANNFLRDGRQLNGFGTDFIGEPLWRTASRQGKIVLSLAYVGADGRSPERKADQGIAYPESSLMGPPQVITLKFADLSPATDWSINSSINNSTISSSIKGQLDPGSKQAEVKILVNPKTGETRMINILLKPTDKFPRIYFSLNKQISDETVPSLEISEPPSQHRDLLFLEDNPSSALHGYKRRIIVRVLQHTDQEVMVSFSRPTYNAAYPEEFRKDLDNANLVWPDYGIHDDKIELNDWLEAQAMIDTFIAEVAKLALKRKNFDIVLLYQPLIDSLGHKVQSQILQPFSANNPDKVTQAFIRAYKIIDKNLSQIFALNEGKGTIAIMGDHGMDAITKSINIAPLLPEVDLSKISILASSDLVLLYPNHELNALDIGQQIRQKLLDLKIDGRPVLGMARKITDYQSPNLSQKEYEKEWQYGQAVWAFAASSGFNLQYQPLNKDLIIEPQTRGMHGKPLEIPSMSTALMIKSPHLTAKTLDMVSMIDVVPTFTELLNINPPLGCLGKSLLK